MCYVAEIAFIVFKAIHQKELHLVDIKHLYVNLNPKIRLLDIVSIQLFNLDVLV